MKDYPFLYFQKKTLRTEENKLEPELQAYP